MKFNLLSTNTKLEKSVAKFGAEIVTAGLGLAPHRRSGHNVCDEAGWCSVVCLAWFSGRMVTPIVRNAMIRRTQLLFTDRPEFDRLLNEDLTRIASRAIATGKTAYVRLNVASDLDWAEAISQFPEIRFYDYCKIKSRCRAAAAGQLPDNYWVTPSYSERMHPASVASYLRHGLNVSVVFDTAYFPQVGRIDPLPTTWRGHPVIDGDTHDLRHSDYDGRGNIVGLRFKGSRKLLSESIKRGFVVAT